MFNFSFSNPKIKDYFFKDSEPPVSEFMYLHSHPLIRPNFVKQIEEVFENTNAYFETHRVSDSVKNKFYSKTLQLAKTLPLSTKSAEEVLAILKSVLLLVKKINPSLVKSLDKSDRVNE